MSAAPRVVHRVVASLALLTSVVALCGCVGEGPDVEPSPSVSVSAAPSFATEEDALAAAVDAYDNYAQTFDLILSQGGSEPERIDKFAAGSARDDARQSFQAFADNGYSSIGTSSFSNVTVQSYDPVAPPGSEFIATYICVDVSTVDVVDTTGASVVSPNRPATQPYEVGYALIDDAVTVIRSDTWSGGGICA